MSLETGPRQEAASQKLQITAGWMQKMGAGRKLQMTVIGELLMTISYRHSYDWLWKGRTTPGRGLYDTNWIHVVRQARHSLNHAG